MVEMKLIDFKELEEKNRKNFSRRVALVTASYIDSIFQTIFL